MTADAGLPLAKGLLAFASVCEAEVEITEARQGDVRSREAPASGEEHDCRGSWKAPDPRGPAPLLLIEGPPIP